MIILFKSNNPTFAESSSEMGRIKNRNFFNEPVSYITTIGLYDDELNMVAVAKLPQPIKSLPDYPVNFIVRFDT